MTEIPEHLLQRSKAAKAKAQGGDAGGETKSDAPVPATTAPAAAAPAAAAPSGPPERAAAPGPDTPEPPKPDIPVVAAYKQRKKVPVWAMMALALLPVWAFMYARAVTSQPVEAAGPLAEGEVIYGNCASCHGGGGQGGVGYGFADGEIIKTFPNIEDQLRFVYWGTSAYQLAGVDGYGDPNREGGARVAGEQGPRPAQGAAAGGALTDYELLGVVCHERYVLGGASEMSEYDEEFEHWCSEESEIFAELEAGADLLTIDEFDDTIIPIGDPAPGQSRVESAEG